MADPAAGPLSEKERVIAGVFYNRAHGFGSQRDTLIAARVLDPTITRSDVREFLANQELRQRRKPTKVNGYLRDIGREEFQCDLADFGERANPRYGFVCVDIFSKHACLIPMHSKTGPEAAEALKKAFALLGYPVYIMCDEGGEFHGEFSQLAKEQNVDIVFSRTGARFVERLIRTLKLDLFERRRVYGGNWSHYAQEVIERYNTHVHSSTGYTPNYLREHEYDFPVQERAYARMASKVEFPTKQRPVVDVGDRVKIRIKQPGAGYKETFNSWSSEVYTVTSVVHANEGTLYHLEGYRRPLLRYELLKVVDVQRHVGGEVRSVLHEVRRPRPAPIAPVGPVAAPVPRAAAPIFRPVTRSAAAAIASAAAHANAAAAAAPPGRRTGAYLEALRGNAAPTPPRLERALEAQGDLPGPLTMSRSARLVPDVPPRRPMTRSQTKRS
jgi:hypothetical protein